MNPVDFFRNILEKRMRYARWEYPSSYLANAEIDEESFQRARELCEEEIEEKG